MSAKRYKRPNDPGSLPKAHAKRRLCLACGRKHIHRTDEIVRFKNGVANPICADLAREAITIETKLFAKMKKIGYILSSLKHIPEGEDARADPLQTHPTRP